ncbi:MAG: hypothetical protein J6L89_08020 [Clostridia bacterium]|nr:hypothetical protein [Clostridia bacterium]
MIEKVLKNGKTVEAYPISASQNMMYLLSILYGAGYPINNIGSGYYWKGEMDFDVMKESIYEAISRCDTMRLRFTRQSKLKILQYLNDKCELEVETWDLSDMTTEEAHNKLQSFSRQLIPYMECDLHKIALVKLPEGYHGIFMRLQHLAMDAYSAKIFLTDILEIYLHKTKGTAYPKPMRPYIPVLEKELAYKETEKYEIDKQYWFDSLAKTEEPIFTDYLIDNRLKKQQAKNPGQRYADIHSGTPDANTLKFDVSAEDTEKIMNLCAEKGLSIFAVLSMGVRTALSAFNDNVEDVSFKMIINRRGTIAEKKSGGLRINFLPMRSIVKPDETFIGAIQSISDVQNEMYQHCDLSFMETLKLRHQSMPKKAKSDSTYDSVGFSYQPLMKMPFFDEEMAKTAHSIWYNNGATMIPLYVTVKHRPDDNGLQFVFEHRQVPDAEFDLTVLYDKIYKSLIIGAENPDIKVGEILEKIKLTEEEKKGGLNKCKSLSHSLKITLKSMKSKLKTISSLISA